MIKRISMWKLKDKALASAMKDKLLSMSGNVSSLQDIEVGINESTHSSAFDIVFIGTFKGKAELEAFEKDDFHKQVGEFVNDVRVERKVVEFTC